MRFIIVRLVWTYTKFCCIHGMKLCTRTYTPGMVASAQPIPQATRPTTWYLPPTLHTKADPPSPWNTEQYLDVTFN